MFGYVTLTGVVATIIFNYKINGQSTRIAEVGVCDGYVKVQILIFTYGQPERRIVGTNIQVFNAPQEYGQLDVIGVIDI